MVARRARRCWPASATAVVHARAAGGGTASPRRPRPAGVAGPPAQSPSRRCRAGRSPRPWARSSPTGRPRPPRRSGSASTSSTPTTIPAVFLVRSRAPGRRHHLVRRLAADPPQRESRLDQGGQRGDLHDDRQDRHPSRRRIACSSTGAGVVGSFPVAVGMPSLPTPDRHLLHQPEAPAADVPAVPTASSPWASARSSRGCRTGRRAARWPSTAQTRTR